MNLLRGSLFLKLAALVFAVVSYFYIHNEIQTSEKDKKISDPSYKLIKLTAKSLAVKLRIGTSPPDGYKIAESKVTVSPDRLIVIGPEALLEEALSVETSIVDVSESTRTAVRRVPLENVAGIHLAGDPYLVDVTIPIEKIAPVAEPGAASK